MLNSKLCYSLLFVGCVASCLINDGCVYNVTSQLLQCTKLIDNLHRNATHLILCHYDNTTLYLTSIIKQLPKLEHISILFSNFTYLRGPLISNNIKSLIINNSTLMRIADNFYQNLQHLQYLDLRNNSLDRLPLRLKQPFSLMHIYLSNNPWNCSINLEWVLNINISIVNDYGLMKCFGGFYSDKPLLPIAIFQKNSQINCPIPCKCTMPNVVRDLNTEILKPIIQVTCSNRQLYHMPNILPNHTTILRLDNNYINDLSPLIQNRFYKNVLDLYLDNNTVDWIGNLEGSKWLTRFRVLSLNGNHLSKLPTYAFDHALEQNPNMPDAVELHLGNNPWKCDCYFTPGFQQMLMKYENQIVDVHNVKCSNLQDDANALLPILSLTRTSVCYQESEAIIHPLDLLNIILAILIVVVLSKLGYDYYHFKRSGTLPWIATKIP